MTVGDLSPAHEDVRVHKAMHAVVIGSGIGGMCAARVLSEHYQRVTLVERDRLPSAAQHRPGVPQSHHGHGLLLRGLEQMDALFPGFAQRLTERGAQRVDLGEQFGHFTEWGWSPRAKTEVKPLSANRLTIEHSMRELLFAQVQNLTVREETRVQRLLIGHDAQAQREGREPRKVVGIEVNSSAGRELIEADLVVDASGKSGKLAQWLEELHLPEPPTEIVDPDSAYASRFYRAPSPWPTRWWWKGLLIDGKPPEQLREAMLLPCGDNVLVLMLIGANGDHPPGDEAGFNAYIRSLRTPYMAEVIAQCQPISPIHRSKRLWNRWRHFEHWQSELPGYLCLGDTLVTFNPFHGQGMTVAAVSAATLSDALSKVGPDPRQLPKTFYRDNAKFVRQAWDVATIIDLGWPRTQGKRNLQWRILALVLRQLCESIHEDAQLKRYLGKLFHLLEPSSVALKPRVLWRFLYTIVRRALFGPAVPRDYDPGFMLAHAATVGDSETARARSETPIDTRSTTIAS
jgi:2-polyprenyl-6-methoxyphenol hydroxylase-like FAD-dependent oxidoreductase